MKHDIQLYHDTRRPCLKGTIDNQRVAVYPLKIRVGGLGRNGGAPFAMGINVSIDQYAEMCAKRTQAKYRDLWNQIDAKMKQADDIVDSMLPFFNSKEFKERFNNKKNLTIAVDRTSLQSVLEFSCAIYQKNNQYPMTVKLKDSVASIIKFVNSGVSRPKDKKDHTKRIDNIPMRSITPEFCRRYEAYMYGKSKKKTLNGVGINMRHLRILFNDAIENNIIPSNWYPFKRESGLKSEFPDAYVIPNEAKVKTYLTIEENKLLLSAAEIRSAADQQAYIAYFFSFYCNGANAADYLEFKFQDIQGKFIVFYRRKVRNATKKAAKPVKVFLSDELKEFIKRFGNKPAPDNYIFPYLKPGMTEEEIYDARCLFNKQVNDGIKRLVSRLGITKDISAGKVRHALANLLRKKGVSRELFKDIFGHTSIITADNYFEQFDEDEYEDLFNNRVRLTDAAVTSHGLAVTG